MEKEQSLSGVIQPTCSDFTERKSVFYFWRVGLLSNKELLRFAMPLSLFLKVNRSDINARYYPLIYKFCQDEGLDIIQRRRTHPRYLIDPELAAPFVKEIEEAVVFDRIRKMGENRVLMKAYINPINQEKPWRRVKREYRKITISEANRQLFENAFADFSKRGLNADELAAEAVSRSQVYLRGEEGHFRSFNHFMYSIFKTIKFHLLVDIRRGNFSE